MTVASETSVIFRLLQVVPTEKAAATQRDLEGTGRGGDEIDPSPSKGQRLNHFWPKDQTVRLSDSNVLDTWLGVWLARYLRSRRSSHY